jgi:hypothetical protein
MTFLCSCFIIIMGLESCFLGITLGSGIFFEHHWVAFFLLGFFYLILYYFDFELYNLFFLL